MPLNQIQLRQATIADLAEMKALFRETIQHVCANEYDAAQRAVWASSSENKERWNALVDDQYVLLAVKDNVIVGFGSLLNDNYLDFMYVHKDHQRQGIADMLLTAFETEAIRLKTTVITSDISKTARPFFEKKGCVVVREQQNERGNVVLVNYKMEKEL
ncbi:GNAT family N-acetyltransferase [Flavobacterium hauense]